MVFGLKKCIRFEYDPAKSATNKAKHGIDFEEIQKIVGREEFDLMFEEDGDVLQYCDLDNPVVSVGGKRQEGRRRVNVDMSAEMIAHLDAQAARYDVPRQALIKMRLVERLGEEEERAARRAS